MKAKSVKRLFTAAAAASMILMTSLPASANEIETRTSGLGVSYTVDFTQGAAVIGGKRVYFGYSAESPRVRACGWRRAVELRAAELADLSVMAPAWWKRYAG